MILNSSKFQAIIFDKHKGNHINQIINIDQKEVNVVSKDKFLGTEIDDKSCFKRHVNNIYKSASDQLNAIIRLKHLLRFEERKVLGKTFVI